MMSFRDMVLQRGYYSETHAYRETESTEIVTFFKCQSPLMLGWLVIMCINLLVMLISFQ